MGYTFDRRDRLWLFGCWQRWQRGGSDVANKYSNRVCIPPNSKSPIHWADSSLEESPSDFPGEEAIFP